MFRYPLYLIGQFIVNHLPVKYSYKIAMFLSDLQYYFSFQDRKAVRDNLRIIVGEQKNLDNLAKEVFRNFGRYLVEFFSMVKVVDEKYIRNNVRVENIHFVNQVLDQGKGGIILTAHVGNFELGAAVLSALDFPVHAVALPHKDRSVNNFFNSQRELKGVTVIPSNIAMRRCINAIHNNELVGLVADRDFGEHGTRLPFLGKTSSIPRGAAVFSLSTEAPLIPTFLLREANGTFRLVIEEPIYPPKSNRGEIDESMVFQLMQRYTKVIESKIRSYPTQWLMFRRFWLEGVKEGV